MGVQIPETRGVPYGPRVPAPSPIGWERAGVRELSQFANEIDRSVRLDRARSLL